MSSLRTLVGNRIFFKSWIYLRKTFSVRNYNSINFEDIPDVTPASIKQTFKQNNINYEDGYTSFIMNCTLCGRQTPTPTKSVPSSNRLYVNKTTGYFMCTMCKSSGQWNVLEKIIIKKTKKGKKDLGIEVLNESTLIENYIEDVEAKTLELQTLTEELRLFISNKFKIPDFKPSLLENLKVRVDRSYTELYFPLENVQMETVGYRIFKDNIDDNKIEPTVTGGGILIGKSTRKKDTAILVPNILDFLTLMNADISRNVICLPNSFLSLPQYILPSFERFNKLILWFGNDIQSWDAARNFAKKLGERRCFFIRPPDQHASPHLEPDQDFKAIISAAQPMWHKSIITFAALRQDVLSDLQNFDKVQGVKWKRFPALNKILKGHRKGELTILTGPTGSGKTTFISEYSLDLAMQGVSTLWGSFEIRNTRLARTMLQQFAGMLLDTNLEQFDYWADQFEKLPVYFLTFHGQQAIKVVMEAVEHATYVHDISHVIIDNVQFMMGLSEDTKHIDRFWKQDLIVASFRNFATRKNCHVTLVIHPRKERDDEELTTSSIFGGAKASQEADNILIIQDKRLASVRGKKYLQVAKNRYTGDLGIMALDFDKTALSYVQKKRTIKSTGSKSSQKTNEDLIDDSQLTPS